jgi:Zn-dependent peptidase ImmA (M78 family)
MERGFKARCDRIVAEVRRELGLAKYAPFDPFAYADLLGIPCQPVSSLASCSEGTLDYIAGAGREYFSAVTVYRDTRIIIVYNDNNTPARQVSDVTHELSHVMLKHKPRPVFADGGCRAWDKEQKRQEEEAAWLSGALLVPTNVALAIARKGVPVEEGAHLYGVSTKMMQYRLNMSGAHKRARREAQGA